MLTVNVTDTAGPFLRRLDQDLDGAPLRHVIGRAARNKFVSHFERLDRARHRPQVAFHFYGRAARATSYRVSGRQILISIAQEGIGLRFFGGTIRLRRRKWFAIPVADESIGKTAREFRGLTRPVLNRRTRKGVMLDKRTGKVLFAMRQDPITQRRDPSVLPTDRALFAAIEPHVNSFFGRISGPADGSTGPGRR